MQNLDTISQTLQKAKAAGADAADAVLFETVDVSVAERLGKPEGLERSENQAIGLRVFAQGRQAAVSATDISPSSLTDLAERAVAMAKAAPGDPDSTLAPPSLLTKSLPDLDLCDKDEPGNAWLAEQCRKAEDAARAVKGITNSEGAHAHYDKSRISLGIMDGQDIAFLHSYPTSHFSLSVSVLAGQGVCMERDYEFTTAHHRADLAAAETIGMSAAERTLKRLNPRKVKSCRVPVVFDPRVSKNLVGILGSAISGTAIARGSSFLKDNMGQRIFPEHITVIDDPHRKRGLGSKPFDGEGVQNKKLTVIEKGVLKSWLLDMRTANRLKLTTTGHAARSLGAAPSPSSTNFYMQKGALAPKALLKDIESGFYVTETFGMGVNVTTGDYSQGATGFWIDHGEIAWPVSEITIAGNLKDMFARMTPANDLVFRYSTNAPTVRVDSMTVAGV